MNPSLPLIGNPPHAAQMPVLPRNAGGPLVAVDASSSGAKRWTAGLGKGRRVGAALADTLLTAVVAISVILVLMAVLISGY